MNSNIKEITDTMLTSGELSSTLNDNFKELDKLIAKREKAILENYSNVSREVQKALDKHTNTINDKLVEIEKQMNQKFNDFETHINTKHNEIISLLTRKK